jgi:hypothetical protein
LLGIFIVSSHPLPLPFGNPVNPWQLGNAAQIKLKVVCGCGCGPANVLSFWILPFINLDFQEYVFVFKRKKIQK